MVYNQSIKFVLGSMQLAAMASEATAMVCVLCVDGLTVWGERGQQTE